MKFLSSVFCLLVLVAIPAEANYSVGEETPVKSGRKLDGDPRQLVEAKTGPKEDFVRLKNWFAANPIQTEKKAVEMLTELEEGRYPGICFGKEKGEEKYSPLFLNTHVYDYKIIGKIVTGSMSLDGPETRSTQAEIDLIHASIGQGIMGLPQPLLERSYCLLETQKPSAWYADKSVVITGKAGRKVSIRPIGNGQYLVHHSEISGPVKVRPEAYCVISTKGEPVVPSEEASKKSKGVQETTESIPLPREQTPETNTPVTVDDAPVINEVASEPAPTTAEIWKAAGGQLDTNGVPFIRTGRAHAAPLVVGQIYNIDSRAYWRYVGNGRYEHP